MNRAGAHRAGGVGFRVAFVALLSALPVHAQEIIELTGEDRSLEADFRELYRIGTLSGEDWEQFGDVHDVAFDGAGNLHIMDTQSDRVFVVGTDGRLVRELGGKGEGPGEFGNAIAMAVMADGRVVVVDMARHGYHVFGPNGDFKHTVGMDGNPSITTVGFIRALPGTDAIIRVPTLARRVRFTGDAFSGPIVLPSSHAIVRSSLAEAEARADTIAQAWLPPTNLEEMSEIEQRNFAPIPTLRLPVFSPELHLDMLPDGLVVFSDSSAYTVKIVEPDRGIVRILTRPFQPEPMSNRVIRAETERRLRRVEESSLTGVVSESTRRFLEDQEYADEIPVIRGLGTTWDGQIWVQRHGDDPLEDGPIDVLTADGRYLGSYLARTAALPTAFGPDGLVAHVEVSDLGVQTVTVQRVVAR